METKRVAVVTGGSSGLGKALIVELKKQGYTCVNFDLNVSTDLDLPADMNYEVDVTKQDQVLDAAKDVLNTYGRIDVLVNNAGINRIRKFEDIAEQDFDDLYAVNVKSIIFMSQAFLEALKESQGTIVNVVSNAADVPFSNSSIYNGSKAAAKMVTMQLAHEVWRRKLGITVFSVSPNKLEGDTSGMNNYILKTVCEVNGWTEEQTKAYQLTSLPAGKETDISTLAEFLGFLLSTKERHRYFHLCNIPYGR